MGPLAEEEADQYRSIGGKVLAYLVVPVWLILSFRYFRRNTNVKIQALSQQEFFATRLGGKAIKESFDAQL